MVLLLHLPVSARVVRLICGLNELALPFNAWIISLPTVQGNGSNTNAILHQVLLAASYAISEALYAYACIFTGLKPFSLVLATSGARLLLSDTFGHKLDTLQAQSAPPHDAKPAPSRQNPHLKEQRWVCATFDYVCSQESAASNASLLLLGQHLLATSEYSGRSDVVAWLSAFAFCFFLFARLDDCLMAYRTRRPFCFGQSGLRSRDTWLQGLLLAMINTLRPLARLALGLEPFAALANAADVEYRFRPGRDAWLYDFASRFPTWFPLALSVFAVSLQLLSKVYWTRVHRSS
jgi:hypothetical protein